ncbi:MAG: hypothetical protein K5773_03185 [Pseudobutyrivibrio sp.]|nr:hypothetical protein [Pseudobutyrivibrio sp.]
MKVEKTQFLTSKEDFLGFLTGTRKFKYDSDRFRDFSVRGFIGFILVISGYLSIIGGFICGFDIRAGADRRSWAGWGVRIALPFKILFMVFRDGFYALDGTLILLLFVNAAYKFLYYSGKAYEGKSLYGKFEAGDPVEPDIAKAQKRGKRRWIPSKGMASMEAEGYYQESFEIFKREIKKVNKNIILNETPAPAEELAGFLGLVPNGFAYSNGKKPIVKMASKVEDILSTFGTIGYVKNGDRVKFKEYKTLFFKNSSKKYVAPDLYVQTFEKAKNIAVEMPVIIECRNLGMIDTANFYKIFRVKSVEEVDASKIIDDPTKEKLINAARNFRNCFLPAENGKGPGFALLVSNKKIIFTIYSYDTLFDMLRRGHVDAAKESFLKGVKAANPFLELFDTDAENRAQANAPQETKEIKPVEEEDKYANPKIGRTNIFGQTVY